MDENNNADNKEEINYVYMQIAVSKSLKNWKQSNSFCNKLWHIFCKHVRIRQGIKICRHEPLYFTKVFHSTANILVLNLWRRELFAYTTNKHGNEF